MKVHPVGVAAMVAAVAWKQDEEAGVCRRYARLFYSENFNVPRSCLQEARILLRDAPDLAEAVAAGTMSLGAATAELWGRRPRDDYGRRLDVPPRRGRLGSDQRWG